MNGKKIALLVVLLLLADQVLKIWVKTHMSIGEMIVMIPDWFQLYFIENNGAAFGMHISSAGAVDWGKIVLSLFRIAMIVLLVWLIRHSVRKQAPRGVLIGFGLILAGAIGNMIDSAFYGLIFSESTAGTVAHLGDGYAGFMTGKVVDMFYFPLFQWENVPGFLRFLVDGRGYFFGAVFNLADAYISVAVVYLLIFQYKYFDSPKKEAKK